MDCTSLYDDLSGGLREHWECHVLQKDPLRAILVTTDVLANGDCVEVVVEQQGSHYLVSDSANTYTLLHSWGIDLLSSQSHTRLEHFQQILARLRLEFEDGEIRRVSNRRDLLPSIATVSEAMREASQMILTLRESQAEDFTDQVYGFFAVRDAKIDRNFVVPGFTKKDKFDLRLNGNEEMLIKTISSTSPGYIQANVERAWFAFNDVRQVGRAFSPAIVYDDTDAEHEGAWRDVHFRILRRHDVKIFALRENEDQLEHLALRHSSH